MFKQMEEPGLPKLLVYTNLNMSSQKVTWSSIKNMFKILQTQKVTGPGSQDLAPEFYGDHPSAPLKIDQVGETGGQHVAT